jgi:predicted small lipoprotein YifL
MTTEAVEASPALVDTDVVSWLALGESRSAEFAPLLAGRKLFVSFVTIAEIKTIAACGAKTVTTTVTAPANSAKSAPPAQQTATAQTEASPTPATRPSTTTFVAAKNWTWDGHTTAEYKAALRIEAGKLGNVNDAPLLTGFATTEGIESGCSGFNSQTDAVMPLQIQITNTTASFSSNVGGRHHRCRF